MKHAQLFVVVILAAVGLAASGLWLWTAQQAWKGVMLERRVGLGEQVSPETLVSLWQQTRALDQTLFPTQHVGLPGFVGQLLIMDQRIPLEVRSEVLADSIHATANALARNPASAHGWARLAWLNQMQGGPPEESVAYLRMSFFAAPAEKNLLFWRILAAGAHKKHWDDDFETILKRQIINAWRVSPKVLVQTAKDAGILSMAEEALAEQGIHLDHADAT